MTERRPEPDDFVTLYRRAFAEYGTQAYGTCGQSTILRQPTLWRSRRPCERTEGWSGGVWRNGLKTSAMPLTKLQSHVLRLLAAERSPDSYIAGGVAINREGLRFSGDIDIFQDTEQRLEAAAEADAKALIDAGLKFI